MTERFLTKSMVDAALPQMGLPVDLLQCLRGALAEAFSKANQSLSASRVNAVIAVALIRNFDPCVLAGMPRVTAKEIADHAARPVSETEPRIY